MTTKEAPPTENVDHLLTQLEEKVKQELNEEHVYEAFQYIQSFIARKKRVLGQKGTSQAVFLGANLLTANYKLIKSKTAAAGSTDQKILTTLGSTTGALLNWFIEDGAGSDYYFHLFPDAPNGNNYCDIENIYNFLSSLETNIAGPIVDTIYNPLHVVIAKTKVKKHSHLARRINKLEILFATIFFANKRWLNAFKCYNRLQDAEKMTQVLNQWSQEGYVTEKPLFFARGVLQLLSENKLSLANDLLHNSVPLLEDNITVGKKAGGPMSVSLAVWHLATILTDLANFPPQQRVDKSKLFGLLLKRYGPFLAQLDSNLFGLLKKIGEVVFNCVLENPNENTPNPMAMLQSLLTGGAMGGAGGGGNPGGNRGSNNNNNNRGGPGGGLGGPGGLNFGELMKLMGQMGQL
jgi:hypothetical protein